LSEIKNAKPCLVETGQGFSVVYQEKFLYSKYNPSKNIVTKITSMEFLPGTIVLAFSPVLEYGLKELADKLPENCIILLCEADKELSEISRENRKKLQDIKNIVPVSEKELFDLPVIFQKASYIFDCGKTVELAGNFRRVIRLDFSAGVQFHADFYNRLEQACVASVRQFWTNRFTLAKFGRRYSHNLFTNLKLLPESKPLSDFIKSQDKTVFVFGAGESSEEGIKEVKKFQRDEVFVLCADTAFPMLKSSGIIPDGIVLDEAQSIIAQSFIGVRKAVPEGVHIFQSLCALPHVADRRFPLKNISFYGTEYAPGTFFESLKGEEFFPPVIPAFGSVGITAYILALLFRKDERVLVYHYGLDFAYSAGKTHARGTPAHKRQLRTMFRLKGTENFSAAFGSDVIRLPESAPYPFTTPVLAGYAETFRQVCEQGNDIVKEIFSAYGEKLRKNTVSSVVNQEKETLLRLRDLLSGKAEMNESERFSEIQALLKNREYLYLHFPDGYKLSMELNFLKRVRGEIDGFLKLMEI